MSENSPRLFFACKQESRTNLSTPAAGLVIQSIEPSLLVPHSEVRTECPAPDQVGSQGQVDLVLTNVRRDVYCRVVEISVYAEKKR